MITTDTIELIKNRRNKYMTRKNSELNAQIKQIRVELVKLTFQKNDNPTQKTQLQEELAALRSKLLRVIN